MNDSEKGIVMVYLSLYNGSSILGNFINTFTIEDYESNLYQKELRMGPNVLTEISPNEYNLYMESQIEDIELNLTYERLTSGFTVNGIKDGKDILWSVEIPMAEVSGYLYKDGQKTGISGVGYMEHCHELFTKIQWDWGLITDVDNEIAVVFIKGEFRNESQGIVVVTDKDSIIFELKYPEMDVQYEEFEAMNNEFIPLPRKIQGSNREYSIEIETEPLIHQNIINPYIIHYNGYIKKDDQILYEIDSLGFYEHEA